MGVGGETTLVAFDIYRLPVRFVIASFSGEFAITGTALVVAE